MPCFQVCPIVIDDVGRRVVGIRHGRSRPAERLRSAGAQFFVLLVGAVMQSEAVAIPGVECGAPAPACDVGLPRLQGQGGELMQDQAVDVVALLFTGDGCDVGVVAGQMDAPVGGQLSAACPAQHIGPQAVAHTGVAVTRCPHPVITHVLVAGVGVAPVQFGRDLFVDVDPDRAVLGRRGVSLLISPPLGVVGLAQAFGYPCVHLVRRLPRPLGIVVPGVRPAGVLFTHPGRCRRSAPRGGNALRRASSRRWWRRGSSSRGGGVRGCQG